MAHRRDGILGASNAWMLRNGARHARACQSTRVSRGCEQASMGVARRTVTWILPQPIFPAEAGGRSRHDRQVLVYNQLIGTGRCWSQT
jgi:hypothetical protein